MKRITSTWRLLGDSLQLGASIVFAIFIGFGIGYWLDGRLGTTPWLTIVFFLFGVAAAGRNVMIEVRKQLRTEKDRDT